MRSSPLLGRALAGALIASFGAASACTALLDGAPSFGTHCAFEGESSSCGECLRESCLDEVDACCGDACGDALERIDACAGGGDLEACAALQAADEDGAAAELAACVARACRAECSSAESITRCNDTSSGCACLIDRGDANRDKCEIDRGGCCAGSDWPSSGSCVCAELGCYDSGYSCTCSSGSTGDGSICDDQGYTYCCRTADGCECQDDYPCFDLELEDAPSCWAGAASCGFGEQEVERCNASEDDLPG